MSTDDWQSERLAMGERYSVLLEGSKVLGFLSANRLAMPTES